VSPFFGSRFDPSSTNQTILPPSHFPPYKTKQNTTRTDHHQPDPKNTTHKNKHRLEILVIDDASTDETAAIVESFITTTTTTAAAATVGSQHGEQGSGSSSGGSKATVRLVRLPAQRGVAGALNEVRGCFDILCVCSFFKYIF
jgi:hypothetical protein